VGVAVSNVLELAVLVLFMICELGVSAHISNFFFTDCDAGIFLLYNNDHVVYMPLRNAGYYSAVSGQWCGMYNIPLTFTHIWK
jgi:hypothetical protein